MKAPDSSMPGLVPVPLTSRQKNHLYLEFAPSAIVVLGIVTYLVLLATETLAAPESWFFWIWLAGLSLLSGHGALRPLRDLRSGTALTREDLLGSIFLSSGKGGRRYYGRFEQLGSLRLGPKVDTRSPDGRRYRIVYSPASRIIWTLDPTEDSGA
jgi:hypothetical protein